jgi:DNA-binding NtrC family response regulator
MQPKLLRALAAREVRRMGENQARKFDVRVVAATNRRLEGEINQGRFREDLYFRLCVLRVDVPPLRERLEDLPLLVGCFLEQLEATDKLALFTEEVIGQMRRHTWPGNVRELRNYVERFVIFDEGSLSSETAGAGPSSTAAPGAPEVDIQVPFRDAKDRTIAEFERAYLTSLLAWAQGNVSRAARKANLDRMYLHRLLQRHGIRRGEPLD